MRRLPLGGKNATFRAVLLTKPQLIWKGEPRNVWGDVLFERKSANGKWRRVALSPHKREKRVDLKVWLPPLGEKNQVLYHRAVFYVYNYCGLGTKRTVGKASWGAFKRTWVKGGKEVGHLGGKWWRVLRAELALQTGEDNRKQRTTDTLRGKRKKDGEM